jgi:hypothetical protein
MFLESAAGRDVAVGVGCLASGIVQL